MNSNSQLISKYQEQNAEITRANVRLNERIAILENVIYGLQQDNIQLRINNAMKQRWKKKGTIKKTKEVKIIKDKDKSNISEKEQLPLLPLPPQYSKLALVEEKQNSSKKRSCSSKPINYILPSTKCKLRKGDPFTFGNEQ